MEITKAFSGDIKGRLFPIFAISFSLELFTVLHFIKKKGEVGIFVYLAFA